MGKSARGLGILALLSVPAVALAQQPPAQPAPQPQEPAQTAAPEGTATAAPEKPKGDPGGYTYTDHPAARPAAHAHRVVRHVGGPVATLPGFEQTADGGSRFFVQLTQNVPVEERKAQGSITYVLKGAHVDRWNNTNALVTVHFNTPVWRARLVPQGRDLLFVVDLRANATPTFKMQDAADHTSMLTIDFAKGDFTNAAMPTDTTEPAASAPAPKTPAPKAAPKQ